MCSTRVRTIFQWPPLGRMNGMNECSGMCLFVCLLFLRGSSASFKVKPQLVNGRFVTDKALKCYNVLVQLILGVYLGMYRTLGIQF